MPLGATDYYQPSSPYVPYILEDLYFKGGYRVFETIADRDQYPSDAANASFGIPEFDSRKPTMMCSVIEEPGKIFYLDSDLQTWKEFEGGTKFTTDAPLTMLADNRLSIDPKFILPQDGAPSKVLTWRMDGTIGWELLPFRAGIRGEVEYQPLDSILSGESHNFELPDISPTIILLQVEINTPEFEIYGWTNGLRVDRNPYLFRSSVDFAQDEGMRYENGEYLKFRRYAILANLEDPVRNLHFFTLKNVGPSAARPTVRIRYLNLQ